MISEYRHAEDFYEVLGVASDASADEIKSAYRRQARRWHPDVNHEPGAVERFKLIGMAYAVLSDPTSREDYDVLRLDAQPPQLRLSTSIVDFGDVAHGDWPAAHHITLFNDGGYGVIEYPEAGRFWRASGYSPDGVAQELVVTPVDAGLSSGQYEDVIQIISRGDTAESVARLTVRMVYTAPAVADPRPVPRSTWIPTSSPPRRSHKARHALIWLMAVMAVVAFIRFGGSGDNSSAVTSPSINTGGNSGPATITTPPPSPSELAATMIANLKFGCVDKYVCRTMPAPQLLPIFIDGMDANLAEYLTDNGYHDKWTDGQGLNVSTIGADGTTSAFARFVSQSDGVDSGMAYNDQLGNGVPSNFVNSSKVWRITWTLFNGQTVVKRLHFAIRVVDCNVEANSKLCQQADKYEDLFSGYRPFNAYQPPAPFPYQSP